MSGYVVAGFPSSVGVIIGVFFLVLLFKWLRKFAIKGSDSSKPPKVQGSNLVVEENNQPPVLLPNEWGLYVGMPYAVMNEWAYNDYQKSDSDGGLSSGWGINDRWDLIYQLYWLLTQGHTYDFYQLRDQIVDAKDGDIQSMKNDILLSELTENDKNERLWQIDMMSTNRMNILNGKYLIWDFCRFSKLCLEGCKQGYITQQEAQTWSLMSASMLRRVYDGWEDMWKNFIATRWLWASGDQDWVSSHQTFSDTIQNIINAEGTLATEENWLMNLPPLDLMSFTRTVAGLGLMKEDKPMTLDEIEEVISQRITLKKLNS
ncbi:DUF1266 domain-containing protein [Proteus hauseri]|uniref:DUF1266 domain-containing protein n=1 Tax=Proteus hauseri TaxID=183417 RepID=UPI00100982EA|nr:DUF1266 domain-containing protein [Proteus hauseri]QAV24102.1 hypothetical protein PH4a_12470 [Proteus hauseri]